MMYKIQLPDEMRTLEADSFETWAGQDGQPGWVLFFAVREGDRSTEVARYRLDYVLAWWRAQVQRGA